MTVQIQEGHALTRLYDLLLWIIHVLNKYPKTQKFLLADRIETVLLDIKDLLIQAAYSKQKTTFLYQANIKIEQVRYLIRLSKDLRYLGIKQYEYAAGKVNEIGREIGGWLKYARQRK